MKPYYEDGSCTIYHGDCREVLADIAIHSVDLLLTDPPYGIEYKSGRSRHEQMVGDDDAEDVLSLLRLALNRLRINRHFYVFGPLPVASLTEGATCDLIWDEGKHGGGDLSIPWGSSHEAITFGVWSPYQSQRGTGAAVARLRRGSVLRFATDNSGKGAIAHPTRKPVPLLRELIEASSLMGELVLDPFMGSGSTIEAARVEGRKSIGIEVEERYCEIAAKRLAQEVLDFGVETGSYL